MTTNWILDFDDTLVSGIITWGWTGAFPKLVADHGLEWDGDRFAGAMLVAQQAGSESPDASAIVDGLFQTMGWPIDLKLALFDDLQRNYGPKLYDDTLPFLQALRGQNVFVISNNPRTERTIDYLDLSDYFTRVFTPANSPPCRPKPQADLWQRLIEEYPDVNTTNTLIVGDDPWSEALFGTACRVPSVIVDRFGRYGSLADQFDCQWITSLHDLL